MQLLDLHRSLHLGQPLVRGGLSLFPVWSTTAVGSPDYDLHPPALTVSELPDSPVVAALLATNSGPRPALLLAGELLTGGRQHRLATRSAVVGAGTAAVLDVRCVEQGRWSGAGGHGRSGRRAPVGVRSRDDQSGVWEQVRRLSPTGTHSLLDAPVDASALQHLRPLPFTTGLLVGIGGQPLLLEAYDSPETLAACWPALLASVAADAARAPQVATPGRRARRFVQRLGSVRLSAPPSGQSVALTGRSTDAQVDALVWRRRTVHAVAVNPRHPLVAE